MDITEHKNLLKWIGIDFFLASFLLNTVVNLQALFNSMWLLKLSWHLNAVMSCTMVWVWYSWDKEQEVKSRWPEEPVDTVQ